MCIDDAARRNRRHWERMVRDGCGYTLPWLDLSRDALTNLGKTPPAERPELAAISRFIRGRELEEKDVLCLACGGGQQSAVFGLLGARVTVVDLAEGQLDGDRRAAKHYGYEIRTLRADMRDLRALDSAAFDIVYGTALCYVPDVPRVFDEVARVLRDGGLYRTDAQQPAIHSVDWDGRCYAITRPYWDSSNPREDSAVEFRHYLDDLFNGLIDRGLAIVRIDDLSKGTRPPRGSTPGSWAHQEPYVGGLFTILARKLSHRAI